MITNCATRLTWMRGLSLVLRPLREWVFLESVHDQVFINILGTDRCSWNSVSLLQLRRLLITILSVQVTWHGERRRQGGWLYNKSVAVGCSDPTSETRETSLRRRCREAFRRSWFSSLDSPDQLWRILLLGAFDVFF